MKKSLLSLIAVGISLQAIPASLAEENDFTVGTLKETKTKTLDFSIIKPKSRMPMLKSLPTAYSTTSSDSYRFKSGVNLPKGRNSLSSNIVEPNNYGNKKYSYTTAVVKPITAPKRTDLNNVATSARPYLTAGKLWVLFDDGWYGCSGSMIGKGVVATAAHCIADFGGGRESVSEEIVFVPAATKSGTRDATAGPIGSWRVEDWVLPTCYINGTCEATDARGVVTSNDLALLILGGDVNSLPYNKGAGIYGYGWDGFGFTKNNSYISRKKKLGQITQLGYPLAIGDTMANRGGAMIRTDSMAVYHQPKKGVKNFIWGSQQTGGSSGGPEIINFGREPVFDNRAYAGLIPDRNVLIGVTSWGFTDRTQQVQGASWFGRNKEFPKAKYKDKAGFNWGGGNIGAIMRYACGKGYMDLNKTYCGY
jgi:hypothetical protein